LETKNVYAERTARGIPPEEVMASIHARSRDNARTPMQWTAGENGGFTTGKPWLRVNPNHTTINAEAALADPDSVFYYYQKLIALRKTYPVFRDGTFTLLCPEDPAVFAYLRQTTEEELLVVCNFTGAEVPFRWPEAFRGAEQLIGNYAGQKDALRPYEGQMYYRRQGTAAAER
jgi:glucan 1,6-alpha-glucosidase